MKLQKDKVIFVGDDVRSRPFTLKCIECSVLHEGGSEMTEKVLMDVEVESDDFYHRKITAAITQSSNDRLAVHWNHTLKIYDVATGTVIQEMQVPKTLLI